MLFLNSVWKSCGVLVCIGYLTGCGLLQLGLCTGGRAGFRPTFVCGGGGGGGGEDLPISLAIRAEDRF